MTSQSSAAEFDDALRDAHSLSIDERIRLLSGKGWFVGHRIPSLNLPVVVMSDGPHGLRLIPKDSVALNDAHEATCFPPAVSLGSSFDVDLVTRVGAAIGEEALAHGIHVVLGPGINLKRSPLCGRNFEYFSEDPLLSGWLGAAWIRGVQSQGVGTSLKHFAANNQETHRMTVNAEIDERTLREMYLRGFHHAVTTAQPTTVMCSYNKVNGSYVCESFELLTTILRHEWGFDGLVVSDWGAVLDRVTSLRAGLDLQMPADPSSPHGIQTAFESGSLDEEIINSSAARYIQLARRTNRSSSESFDENAHHQLAREAAQRSIVLLKNEQNILPLSPALSSLCVVGAFAASPRIQGSGSSRVTPTREVTPLQALQDALPQCAITYEPGFGLEDHSEDDTLATSARKACLRADVTVAFVGLAHIEESEGYDRQHLALHPSQVSLIRDLARLAPRLVVVMTNGGVVVGDWMDKVSTLVEAWLPGQGGPEAIVDVLTGVVSPSGRLTETIARREADYPSFLHFPGEHHSVRYAEGIFVGYRGFDAVDRDVAFPFGHGLSYTNFSYSNLAVMPQGDSFLCTLEVTNTGNRSGHEVVQVYTGLSSSAVPRAPRELKGVSVVYLAPGETTSVTISLSRQDLSYYDVRVHDWVVEPGSYNVFVGASSRDIRLQTAVDVAGDEVDIPLTANSTFAEWLHNPRGAVILASLLEKSPAGVVDAARADVTFWAMLQEFRLAQALNFLMVPLDIAAMEDALRKK